MDYIQYDIESKLVNSAWSKEYHSKIITICFNCKEFGVMAHSYNTGHYSFCTNDTDLFEMDKEEIKLDSEHINKLNAGWYSQSYSQDGEQIQYTFVPIYMVLSEIMWYKHKERVLEGLPHLVKAIQSKLLTANEEDSVFYNRELNNLKLTMRYVKNY